MEWSMIICLPEVSTQKCYHDFSFPHHWASGWHPYSSLKVMCTPPIDLWLANTIYKISSREPNMWLLAFQDYSAWLTGMKAEYHA